MKIMNLVMAALMQEGGGGGWDIGGILQGLTKVGKEWGNYFIILMGVIMLLVGAFHIAKGLMSQGRSQVNWALAIILIIAGGAFMAGGWTLIQDLASGGEATIRQIPGADTILMNLLPR